MATNEILIIIGIDQKWKVEKINNKVIPHSIQ